MTSTLREITENLVSTSNERLTWTKSIFYKFKNMRKKSLVFTAISSVSVFALLMMVIGVMTYLKSPQDRLAALQSKKSDTILHELGDISVQIQQIALNPNESKKAQAALKTMQKDISFIEKSIAEIAKASDVQKVSSQIESVKEDVDTQMSDIKKTVSESMGNKQYLEPGVLPFRVVAVDVIGGQPYVSVNYADHVTPLGVSDLLAGWRLVAADYDDNFAEFVNEKKQYIKVNLQGG